MGQSSNVLSPTLRMTKLDPKTWKTDILANHIISEFVRLEATVRFCKASCSSLQHFDNYRHKIQYHEDNCVSK